MHHGAAQRHYDKAVENGLAKGRAVKLIQISMKSEFALRHIINGDISIVPKSLAVYCHVPVDYENLPGLQPRNDGYFVVRQPSILLQVPASLTNIAYGAAPGTPGDRAQQRTGPYQPIHGMSPGNPADLADDDAQAFAPQAPLAEPSNASLNSH